ncbi:HpcH/HpaI aldolase/citrate lyase family protein [Agrobacterium sp. rho-8.1]|nr:CoA ester lyase [Agrobacterium sp. rho-8.1]
MADFYFNDTARPRRSLLSVPAINLRALAKLGTLECDGVIFDLEDSVAPEMKDEARNNLLTFFRETPLVGREAMIRINPISTTTGLSDLKVVLACAPDAILLPKVEQPSHIQDVADWLAEADAPDGLKIWAMIETPKGILNVAAIAEASHTLGARLGGFVVGLNDLRKETRVPAQTGRTYLLPWLMQIVLAARAYGLDVIDSVSNEFRDLDAFAEECGQGRAMGFDGKMLIHPSQIEAANQAFAPDEKSLAEAHEIIATFAKPESVGLNVINSNGRMIERLHVDQAKRLVAMAAIIEQMKGKKA